MKAKEYRNASTAERELYLGTRQLKHYRATRTCRNAKKDEHMKTTNEADCHPKPVDVSAMRQECWDQATR